MFHQRGRCAQNGHPALHAGFRNLHRRHDCSPAGDRKIDVAARCPPSNYAPASTSTAAAALWRCLWHCSATLPAAAADPAAAVATASPTASSSTSAAAAAFWRCLWHCSATLPAATRNTARRCRWRRSRRSSWHCRCVQATQARYVLPRQRHSARTHGGNRRHRRRCFRRRRRRRRSCSRRRHCSPRRLLLQTLPR